MQRIRPNSRILLIALLSLLAGVLAVLFDLSGLLLHPADRGFYEVGADNADVLIAADGSCIVAFRDDAGTKPRYVERLYAEISLPDDKPALIRETVRFSGSMQTERTDCHPVFVGADVVRIRRADVSVIELSPEGGGSFRIGRIFIDNELRINKYLFACTLLGAAGLLFLLFFRDELSGRLWAAFLVSCLLLGASLVLSLPRNKVGYDEETHLQAVMDMASFPSGELHLSPALMDQLLVTEHNNPEAQPGNSAEMSLLDAYLNENADYKTGERTPEFTTLKNRMPAYAAMAFAVKAGKFLSLPWSRILLLARAANLLQYALIMSFAVWLAPFGKRLLALIGLFPQNLFLACTVSYDPFVTACLAAGTAAVLRLITKEGKATPAELSLPLFLLFLGCLPKAVYAPLVLLGLAVPEERFRGKGQHRAFCSACLLVFILLLCTFILPTAVAPADTGDVRGGEVSELSQVGFILGHPLKYAFILLRQMVLWIPQCWFGADCITFMGHLVNGNTVSRGPYVPYLALIVLAVLSERSEKGFGAGRRVFSFLLTGASAVLIWTSMYVAFTEPGAPFINGVQGRYFIPLLWPLYLLFLRPCGEEGKLETNSRIWYYLLVILPYLLLAFCVYRYAVSAFCL